MTALCNDEVRLLTRLYFHYESGRSAPDYREMLHYAERSYLTPEKSRAQLDRLIDCGFVEPFHDDSLDKVNLRITSNGVGWFERNVDYWRACNQYTFNPLAHDRKPEAKPSIAARLRDPFVPGAAIAGVIATFLISWFL